MKHARMTAVATLAALCGCAGGPRIMSQGETKSGDRRVVALPPAATPPNWWFSEWFRG